jgi:Membrane domain of glycerophosphoryl diester phosphodiesterase
VETAELRPLSLGELLDRTFTLYRNHFWVFVGIMALPASFGIPVNYLILSFQGSLMVAPGKPPQMPSPGLIFGAFAGYFAFVVLLLFVYSIAVAAVTHAVSEAYLGRSSTVRDSYRSIQGKFWRLMGVVSNIGIRMFGILMLVFMVIAGVGGALIAAAATGGQAVVAVALGFLILLLYAFGLVAAVYLALRYAVSIPALMLENLSVLAAIRRSVQLTRGRRGHIFIAFLLAWIVGLVGYIVFQAPFSIATMLALFRNQHLPAWLALSTAVAGAVGGATTGPISMIVVVLCYYDTRIRKEAFDLQFMMASLDRPSPATDTVPSA